MAPNRRMNSFATNKNSSGAVFQEPMRLNRVEPKLSPPPPSPLPVKNYHRAFPEMIDLDGTGVTEIHPISAPSNGQIGGHKVERVTPGPPVPPRGSPLPSKTSMLTQQMSLSSRNSSGTSENFIGSPNGLTVGVGGCGADANELIAGLTNVETMGNATYVSNVLTGGIGEAGGVSVQSVAVQPRRDSPRHPTPTSLSHLLTSSSQSSMNNNSVSPPPTHNNHVTTKTSSSPPHRYILTDVMTKTSPKRQKPIAPTPPARNVNRVKY